MGSFRTAQNNIPGAVRDRSIAEECIDDLPLPILLHEGAVIETLFHLIESGITPDPIPRIDLHIRVNTQLAEDIL